MDDTAFTTSSIDDNTQTILLAATNHDLETLKPLLRIPGNASVQDPETGTTPLHAAIAACGSSTIKSNSADIKAPENGEREKTGDVEEEEYGDPTKAAEVIKELFLSGAIWNDLDTNNETPGCLAWRLGQMELYQLCVEAGVRAELLLAIMGGYEELSSGPDEEDEQIEDAAENVKNGTNDEPQTVIHNLAVGPAEEETEPSKKDVNSADYLASSLKFTPTALLDDSNNGVMMSWETAIMRKTVDLLLPSLPAGARILNIGFGMGIIDSMFQSTSPSVHHIIEAHPSVLSNIPSPFSSYNQSPTPSSDLQIFPGRWQDIVSSLLESGQIYDAIYFDTFAESYSQLKFFFDEYIPGLLAPDGKFGFFNGLGADRRVCYDVYCKVVECHAEEAGLEVEWTDVDVEEGKDGVGEMGKEGEGEWEGVRRRYWVLQKYRLPILRFLG